MKFLILNHLAKVRLQPRSIVSPIAALALAIAPALAGINSTAFATEISSALTPLSNVDTNLSCSQNDYYTPQQQPIPGKVYSNCNSCKQKLGSIVDDTKKKISQASTSSSGIDASGGSNINAGANQSTGTAQNTQSTANTGANTAKAAQQQKAALAGSASAAAQECVQRVKSECSPDTLAQQDKQKTDDVISACQQSQKVADAVQTEKNSNANGMGDLGQLAQAAMGALGPLAQMLANKDKNEDPAANDTSDIAAGNTTTPSSQGLGSSSSAPGVKIASGSSGNAAKLDSAFTDGNYATAASRDPASYGSYGSNSLGDAGNPASAEVADASSGGSGGGVGSFGSTGASSMKEGSNAASEDAAAADAASGYELGYGGGGRSSFLGLKSKGVGDLDALGLPGEAGKLDGLSLPGEETLAANEDDLSGTDGVNDESTSLFIVIHSKMKEMKKRGSI